MIDVNALVGSYPFRHVPHPEPAALLRVLDRERIEAAWVGHLPSAFYRDPQHGNRELLSQIASHGERLRPVLTVRPDWPRWERELRAAREAGAPAVRAYPAQWGLSSHDSSMRELALAAGELGLALMLTVRFEDLRQRHLLDAAGDLTAAAIRALARAGDQVRLIVTAAGRDMLEEVRLSHVNRRSTRRATARLLGHLMDLGPARGSSCEAFSDDRFTPVRIRKSVAPSPRAESERESRAPSRRRARLAARKH